MKILHDFEMLVLAAPVRMQNLHLIAGCFRVLVC
jgi:hypothetical protein